jgi:hypothetical protein
MEWLVIFLFVALGAAIGSMVENIYLTCKLIKAEREVDRYCLGNSFLQMKVTKMENKIEQCKRLIAFYENERNKED